MQDYADKVNDLTDDSETTFMQHHVFVHITIIIMHSNSPLTYL